MRSVECGTLMSRGSGAQQLIRCLRIAGRSITKNRIHNGLFIGLTVTALAAQPAAAGVLTQTDTFDSGVENWTGMGGAPGGSITNIATGGPGGAGDAYMQLERTGTPFHIATSNTDQWTGDFLADCITALRVDFNHIAGMDPLYMRIMIWGNGGVWGSAGTIPLPAPGAGWNTYIFGLTVADLVYVSGGTTNLADTLSTVSRIQIRHDYTGAPTPPGLHPPHILGTIGVDNIEAIAQPLITDIAATSGVVELEISNVNTDATYYVESNDDLTTNTWMEVGSSFEGVKGTTNWMDSIGGAEASFYRVIRDPYLPEVGEVAVFTNYAHSITGTAHIVNNRTIELRNFSYDGGGPAVYVTVGSTSPSGLGWGTWISGIIGLGTPYMETNLTYTIPNSIDLEDVNYISIWCDQFGVDFGSGMFQ